MINCKEDIYNESFNDTIAEFDYYVQESALLVAGVIVGVGALIAAIIFIIRKIFFKTENQKSAGSIMSVLKSIWAKTSSGHYTDTVHVYGVDFQKLADVIEKIKDIVESFDKLIDAIKSKTNTEQIIAKITSQINIAQTLVNSIINENIQPGSGEGWTSMYLLELKRSSKSMMDNCKTLADMCRKIDKKAKSVPNDNTDFSNVNKNFTSLMTNFGKQSEKIEKRVHFKEKSETI